MARKERHKYCRRKKEDLINFQKFFNAGENGRQRKQRRNKERELEKEDIQEIIQKLKNYESWKKYSNHKNYKELKKGLLERIEYILISKTCTH